jgi:uncharacterized protein YgiM (DUF1202 family)
MSLRSRCAIAVAAGALLATVAAAAPAVAGDDWGHHNGDNNSDQRFYQGVVTTDSLALRSAPTRGSQVIRYASRGEILNIFCKVGGPSVHGNPLWYQIADGTWAWGPARFIDNVGPAPRWC